MAGRGPALIFVSGASPGLGKSSLAAALVASLRAHGTPADLFAEERILTDDAYSEAMEEFRMTGSVNLDALLAAARDYLASVREGLNDVVVLDALFPHLPSLLAWGRTDQEITAFFVRLQSLLMGFRVLEVHLVGEPRSALTRAVAREGQDWLDQHIAKVARYEPRRDVSTAEDVVAYYEACAARSRTLLAAAPWPVEFIDAADGEDAVLARAATAIESALASSTEHRPPTK